MHGDPARVLERAERVLRERILSHVHEPVGALHVASHELVGEPIPVTEVLGAAGEELIDFRPFTVPGAWGGVWTTTWFRVEGQLPTQENRPLELVMDLGWFDHSVGGHVEGLVFRPDGRVLKALHPRNGWARLRGPGVQDEPVRGDGSFVLYVEAAANPLLLGLPPFVETHLGDRITPAEDPYILRNAAICAFNEDVWELGRDLEVVVGLAHKLDRAEPRFWRVVRAIETALDAFDEDDLSTSGAAREALSPVLASPAHASAHQVTAVGHAHIDSAWLWPVRETRRKLGRTVSNVLALMDADDTFIYTMSAGQHFTWLEQCYPDLYARMLERVREGRFVPVGGMWIEPDGMIPTGESLVRQMSLGVRDTIERFGFRTHEVWLPDSFGYSGALPQLARRAGFRWFLTQKISWNDTTVFPHHSFWWKGIDGTPIFTHFPPADTYAAEVTAAELSHAVTNFRDKSVASHSMMAFGYGDGGGGPTREMVARADRFSNLEGAPRVLPRTPAEFFHDAEEELRIADAPEWFGELYLELHRGTLTSQVAMKQGNRRAESLLRVAEYLATVAALRADAAYPHAALDDVWRRVLLNQFHDILPGTSIPWVHREARAEHVDIETQVRNLAAASVRALGGAHTPGRLLPVASDEGKNWGADGENKGSVVSSDEDGERVFANEHLRVRFNAQGHVTSLVDLAAEREVVATGHRLGMLQVFRDEATRWDAWDLDRHVLRHPQDIESADSVETVQDGASAGLRVVRSFNESSFTMTWWLRPAARDLELEVDVDWREREHLLKVAFPLAAGVREAHFETQYGTIPRPVHANTAADEAQFEVCTHRFVQLRQPGYCVSVVNDGTYGADTLPLPNGTLVRTSLVRSARFPDPDMDLGRHCFRMAVVASPELRETLVTASRLNAPELEALPEVEPLLLLDAVAGDVVLDWIKLADDGSGDVVARLYEPFGATAKAVLRPGPELQSMRVRETNLLEEDELPADLPTALGPDARDTAAPDATVSLLPYQVATLRFAR